MKFEIYQRTDGEFSWRARASNGEITASGEGHKTKYGAVRAIEQFARSFMRSFAEKDFILTSLIVEV